MNFTLKRSKNRRRSLSLQVNKVGEVVVRAPLYVPRFFINRFVSERSAWITKEQDKRLNPPRPQQKYFASLRSLEAFIQERLVKYSALTGLQPTNFRLREVSSYWGSCSPRGVLSFNTRLLFAPPDCVEYVVVHELSHLKYRGHGTKFWALVTKHYPNTKLARSKLRQLPKSLI